MKKWLSTCEILLGGALWGCINLFAKTLSAAGLSALQITAVRLIVASVCFTIFLAAVSPKQLKIRLRDAWMFVGTGIVSVVLFNICYFYTMIHGEASVAVILLYTSPIFILLISAVLFHERMTAPKLIALGLTMVGSVLTAGLLTAGGLTLPVFLIGIGSGFFYGLYTIFSRFALRKYSSVTVSAYTFLFGAAGILLFCDVPFIVKTVKATPSLLWWCVGIGILCTVLPYLLYTEGLRGTEAGKAAILVETEPLVGALLGIFVFRESAGALKLLGIAMILVAIAVLELPPRKKRGEPGQ